MESAYPYTATDGTCSRAFSHPYKLTSWYYVVGGNDWSVPSVNSIKQAIYTYGPVSVGVCAGNRFSNYTSGIFATDEKAVCGGYTNHAVVLTGWDNMTSSWILRNSWGIYWGERGYMRIRWGISGRRGCQLCRLSRSPGCSKVNRTFWDNKDHQSPKVPMGCSC